MAKREKNHGFRVPKGYFEAFDENLHKRASSARKQGFKVPEGYFENFEVSLDKETGSPRVIKLRKRKSKYLIWMGVAASVLLFFGIRAVTFTPSELNWNELEAAEISSWIDSDWTELDALDIAEVYPDVELEASTLDSDELDAYLNEIELDQILYEN